MQQGHPQPCLGSQERQVKEIGVSCFAAASTGVVWTPHTRARS